MDFRILGPLEVDRDGRALKLAGARERAILAILLLHANEIVSTDALIDRVWPSEPPSTAGKALQVYVSRLRKELGTDVIVTRSPGYLIRVGPDELDLHRFEQLFDRAHGAEPRVASELLREALSLWRGAPLADFAYDAFAQAEVARLEELRFAALEERLQADLALGRHGQLVGELDSLVAEFPLRERLRELLMLALYRAGRQAEALALYQEGRRLLDEELGLEPSESLKSLQKAILAHDPALDATGPAASIVEPAAPRGSILVVVRDLGLLDPLVGLAGALSRSSPPRELIVAHVASPDEIGSASATLQERRATLLAEGISARAASFSSPDPSGDVARLATEHDVDLILLDAGSAPLDAGTSELLTIASCDVALFIEAGGALGTGPVVVPFGAAEHDWAALELGAWVARSTDRPLRLIGAEATVNGDGRDASRLLADASLIVQLTANVAAEPLLAPPGRQGVRALAAGAGLLVVGFPQRWRTEGLGPLRTEIADSPPAPTVFVRRGVRPGGLAPSNTRTRFTWSLTAASTR
jgi:DNA-binding SARP family transcriptional activator